MREPGLGLGDRDLAVSTHETIDRVFDGRVAVIQRRHGFRFALDSLLLARFVELRGRERIVDLGAGNGVIALSVGVLNRGVEVTGGWSCRRPWWTGRSGVRR